MHSFTNCICIACVLAERSRSAPQALGYRARNGRCCPVSAPPRATAQARPSPRAYACYWPATDRYLYDLVAFCQPGWSLW
eukprot:6188753-Pleurochrysis_carterae.AAC.1